MTQAVIASCFNTPTPLITLKLIAQTNYPPFLGVKFRVKTPPTRFLAFLNTLVFATF